jgi:hypothetical protein
MSTDLETRITTALSDAAATTAVDDGALTSILQRAQTPSHTQTRWVFIGGLGLATVVTAVALIISNSSGTGPSNLAFIQPSSSGSDGSGCGDLGQRVVSPAEVAQVAYLPDTLPEGYRAIDQPPAASVQQRAASSVDCWSAETTYLETATGQLLTSTVSRQGSEPQPGCELPDGYLPMECIMIGDRPASLSHEGTVATVMWITAADEFAYVSGYGFTPEQIVASAESLTFDGTNVALTPPTAMTQIENHPKTRDDNREVTYFSAGFTNTNDPTLRIGLNVTTWNDISINQVGPASTIDIDGTTALVVTTGGPGTGITGWTNDPTGFTSVNDVVPFDLPANTYVTWTSNGVTFRVEGSDRAAVIEIAQSLRPA